MSLLPFEPIISANLEVRIAANTAEIEASQCLRYRVFCEEMGGLATPEINAQKRDFDEFDAVCDHLLVLDNNLPEAERVVGTYRLLRRSSMEKLGRFYSETEYDVSAIKATDGEILELGRSCVDKGYRSRPVMQLLWRGIGAYVGAYDIKLMFGCASFFGTDPQEHTAALSYLHHYHLAPENRRMKALPHLYVDMNLMPKEAIDQKRALASLPPLIKGYLRLNGWVGEGAVIDPAYNTTDVSIVVETDVVGEKYHDRYGA